MLNKTIAKLTLVFATLSTTPAYALDACMDNILDYASALKKEFGESVIGEPIKKEDGTLFVAFSNNKTGTWSLVKVAPDGRSCLSNSGQPFPGAASKEAAYSCK